MAVNALMDCDKCEAGLALMWLKNFCGQCWESLWRSHQCLAELLGQGPFWLGSGQACILEGFLK